MNITELKEYKTKLAKLDELEKKKRDVYLSKIAKGEIQGPQTEYSSINKTSLKYFTEDEIMGDIPKETCYEALYNNNINHKDDVCFEYLERKYTYGEFFELIDKTKEALVASGVKDGDVVTVCSITTPEILALFYALNRIGAVPNFVDLRYPANTIKNYINEAKSDYVFTLDLVMPLFNKISNDIDTKEIIYLNAANGSLKPISFISKLKAKHDKLVSNNKKFVNWDNFINRKAEPTDDVSYVPDKPAAIVHTGGTTGVPKGVVLSNDDFNSIIYQVKTARTKQRRGWKFLNIMPPFIAYGLGLGLYAPLVLGWNTVIIPKFEANDFSKLLKKHKPNGVMGVPAYWLNVMNDKKNKKLNLSFLDDVLVGGDKTPSAIENRINQYLKDHNSNAILSKGYSMTEASSLATFSNRIANKPESVGIPLVKTTIAAFEPGTQNELPVGEVGELCIQSTNMMVEYFENEEETEKVKQLHEDGYWIHSGDIGYVDKDGIVFVNDRIKRMIIRSGFKVFPSEIEKRINKIHFINSSAVVGIPDAVDVTVPKLYVTLKEGTYVTKEQALETINRFFDEVDLPPYFRPTEIEIIDQLPLTLIGKVDYDKLKDLSVGKTLTKTK